MLRKLALHMQKYQTRPYHDFSCIHLLAEGISFSFVDEQYFIPLMHHIFLIQSSVDSWVDSVILDTVN